MIRGLAGRLRSHGEAKSAESCQRARRQGGTLGEHPLELSDTRQVRYPYATVAKGHRKGWARREERWDARRPL